jgi:hypothetical protein
MTLRRWPSKAENDQEIAADVFIAGPAHAQGPAAQRGGVAKKD